MDIKYTSIVVLILLITSPEVMSVDGMDDLDSEKLSPPKTIVSSSASSSTAQDLPSTTPLIRCIPVLWEEFPKTGVTEDIVVAKSGKIVTVISDNRKLHTYQLTSKRFKVAPGERIKVTYVITADEKEIIALNFLNSKRDNWYWEINPFLLKKSKHSGTLKAVVPQGESETSLIFYNNRATTASTQFTIHDLKIEVHPPFTSTPATTRFSRLIRGVFDPSPEPSLAPSLAPSPASSSTNQDLLLATPLIRCIPGLWEEALKRGVTEDIVVVKNGKFITVLSDNRELRTCQLTTKRFDVTPGERIKVTYNITADADEIIALNFLNSKRDNWYWEINPFLLKKGNKTGTFEAVVPQGERETSLIFYNNRATATSTQFTIHDLKIEVHPPFTSTPARTRFSQLTWGVFDPSLEPSLAPSPASSSTSQDSLSAISLSKFVEVSVEKALKTEVTEGAVVTKIGRFVTVFSDNTTPRTPQAKTNKFDVVPGERIKVTYNITADEGGIIGLDFLNSEGDNYYPETNPVVLKKGKNTGTFEAIVPEGESETSLIFYNKCVASISTRFTIHSLKIEIFPQ